MKRLLIIFLILGVLFGTSTFASAGWTLTPTILEQADHLLTWQVVCTSDGNALTATDIMASMGDRLKAKVGGSLAMIMSVVPGTAGVIPNTTIDVTLSDANGYTLYAHTSISKDANTYGLDLSEDYKQYLPIFGQFKLALNDIGDSGDQVTLVFYCWKEKI